MSIAFLLLSCFVAMPAAMRTPCLDARNARGLRNRADDAFGFDAGGHFFACRDVTDHRQVDTPNGLAERKVGWEPGHVRVLCATTANDGHFGPLLPFARALAEAGHEVRVAAPASYAGVVAKAGFVHEPFADAPRELIGPVMGRLPTLAFEEADDLVIREVFARIDAQAALPSLVETVERWRPDLMLRETAELASLAAAERAGVPHVHVCIGMHEVLPRFARGRQRSTGGTRAAGRSGRGSDDFRAGLRDRPQPGARGPRPPEWAGAVGKR